MASLSFIHWIKHSDHISKWLMKREMPPFVTPFSMLISSQIHFIYFHQSWDTQGSGHKTWPEPWAPPDMQLGPYTDLLFWPESFHTLLSFPALVPGTGGRSKKTIYSKLLAHAHKRSVMCVAQRVIIDLWRRKIGVRFVANRCESHKQMNIYQQMTFGQT